MDAPKDINVDERDEKDKYLVTFPYPYMNGKLHLGHAFSLTKAEFQARFQRMLGKKVLFPFSFHCTGMPISAAAKKLGIEMETYGCPPKFPADDETPRQWKILSGMSIPDEEIPKFTDPLYWLKYFPPLAREDLKKFGCAVDLRRSFITTDVNPYYDKFIQWQFEQLKEKNLIGFGARYSVFSPSDNQPCADHDRSKGEGVKPKEYTIVKLQVQEPFPEALKQFEGKNVYFGAATLRPETMYGQTNCWLKADGEYGAFQINDSDIFVLSERSARNLAFQNFSHTPGKVECLAKVQGRELFGTALKAPYAAYDKIYVLPMQAVDMEKTTGVVTSVPADSPDDYATYMDIRKKPEYYAKEYGIKQEWVSHDIVPIIDIPEVGDRSAEHFCNFHKVASQNDRNALEKAHDDCYKLGFAHGVLKVGKYAGTPVKDAKDVIRKELIDANLAIPYSEPEELVVSRSGDVCVVALTDQWYIKYGEEEWKNALSEYLDNHFKYYNPTTFNDLKETVDWLREWGCSREFGLGTKLPWDTKYLIESLSDSTIYMAYYTIAHLLQGGVLDGSEEGPAKVKPEQLTREVFDYIYHERDYPQDCGIPKDTLDLMRREFRFWYPVDLRVSAKDLIKNHLTMFLYNHMAIWGQKYAPRSIYANGYVMVDGDKMSKSLGNFLTMEDAILEFGSDAVRLAMADAGDSEGDANFERSTANAAILKLYVFIEWIQEVLNARAGKEGHIKVRKGEKHFVDRVFESTIRSLVVQTKERYEGMYFKEGLQYGWFSFQSAQHTYQTETDNMDLGMHEDVLMEFIESQVLMLAPICPHTMEYIWREMLGREGSVCNQKFPEAREFDAELIQQHKYVEDCITAFRQKLIKDERFLQKNKLSPNVTLVYIADSYVEWQQRALKCLRDVFEQDGNLNDMGKVAKALKPAFSKKEMKQVMVFVATKRQEFNEKGESALADKVPYDGHAILSAYLPHITTQLGMKEVRLYKTSEESIPDPMKRVQTARPGYPSVAWVQEE